MSADSRVEQRNARRTSIFLSAHVSYEGGRIPVTLRDISSSGARLQGQVPTPVGSTLTLERGRLAAPAKLAWRTATSAGLKFDVPVTVEDWLLDQAEGQDRVNRLIDRTRAGAADSPAKLKPPSPIILRERLIEEIGFAERLFEALGDSLADDPHVVARFGKQLQSLELGCKILQNVAYLLGHDDPRDAVDQVGLHEMKARLLRGSL